MLKASDNTMDIQTGKTSWKWRFCRILADKRGVAAVEFALIFPIMIALYLGSVEISGALQANKSVGKIASSVGDLITQQEEVTTTDLRSIAEIGEAILFPYTMTRPTIEMVGIQLDGSAAGRVAWARSYANGSLRAHLRANAIINVPARLRIPNTFIVKATAKLAYRPVVTWSTPDGGSINMEETYYLRPRISGTVDCTNC